MLITVVIPTLDRPALLLEAARSVARQTHTDWEVVVVDDGSQPPVDRDALAAVLGNRLKLVRHAAPSGVPEAKNAGLRAATGEVITLLDDDDLLSERALERIAGTFTRHPELDCVFLNVEPFGRFASGSVANQARAMTNFMQRVSTREADGIVFLADGLFEALLRSVPLALQRPAARRGAWNIVGEFTTGLMYSEPDWTIRASLCCRTALLREPLSRWRSEGQNFSVRPDTRARVAENGVRTAALLRERVRAQYARQRQYVRHCRRYLADAHFNQAYQSANSDGKTVWGPLCRSFLLTPGWKHLRLGLRHLLGSSLYKTAKRSAQADG